MEGGSEMSETPTPETDKAEDYDPMMEEKWQWIVPSSFARRLERERDEARRERDDVLQRLSLWEGAVMRMKKQLSFAPPFHQGIASQEEA
jgi:hypothetical protein